MTEIIELPKEYGYVVLVLVSYTLLNLWMSLQVTKARKKYCFTAILNSNIDLGPKEIVTELDIKRYRVPYPNLYASEERNKDARLFNCIQRGHQNSLEFVPLFFTLLLVGGLYYPLVVTGLGAVYMIGRFFYFKGYSTGVPEKRMKAGRISFSALFGLMICTGLFGVNLVLKAMN